MECTDRLLTFNGENLLFDPAMNDLWCIDNAKSPLRGLSSTDDSDWKQWVIECTHEQDDNTVDPTTDKGKTFPELFHWMIYKRHFIKIPSLEQKLSDQATNETATAIKEAFTLTRRALLKLVNETGLPQQVRDRLRQRLAFLDARNKFTDLLGFAEFETIPTPKNPWFGKKLARAAGRAILGTSAEQQRADEWKETARKTTTTDDELEELDEEISEYLLDYPKDKKPDQRVTKALFAARSERFVRSLRAHTRDLAGLQNLPANNKAWGKLDPAVTDGIHKIANDWAKELLKVDDKEGAQEVVAAMDKFLEQLKKVAG